MLHPIHGIYLRSTEMERQTTFKLQDFIDTKRFSAADVRKMNRALQFAHIAHEKQFRLSGDPYIVHPIQVSRMLDEMGFNANVIIAGLLHDTVEDTAITLAELRDAFGDDVAELVDGVTKISRIRSENIKQRQAENIRKMLLSMVNDIRIILIKLADKLHNMRTLEYLDKERAERIARETLDIYAPLAGRLGMARIKIELEDLALKTLEPEMYEDIKKYIFQKKNARERYIERVKGILQNEFSTHGISAMIYGRVKHFYSIYRKMKDRDKGFEEIYDLFAMRIVTNSVRGCYEILGVVHKLWMPVRGRFKDYIAMPKNNMYQSLHTTVIGPDGKSLEVQIRTAEMDNVAEEGIAAHWAYKEGHREPKGMQKELRWLNKLKSWKENLDNPGGFMEDLQKDLLMDEIYVFTPKGDVVELPIGSTPIDFAYKIHTEIGNRCIGAKVNGRIIPLRRPLHSCESVEILTSKNGTPSREWLDVVKTSRARHKIRAYFSKLEGVKDEEKEEETQQASPEKKSRKTTRPSTGVPEHKDYRLVAEGERNVQLNLARCCNPHPGDAIIGYITRGKGITVHRIDCKNLRALRDYEKRMISVEWEEKTKKIFHVNVDARDRSGLLMDISTAIANSNANIIELHLKADHSGHVKVTCRIQLSDEQQLRIILDTIESIPEVTSLTCR
jgi:guanosine-3',5'-bis(diphosphate) 3'-pyrophosphohydrolase